MKAQAPEATRVNVPKPIDRFHTYLPLDAHEQTRQEGEREPKYEYGTVTESIDRVPCVELTVLVTLINYRSLILPSLQTVPNPRAAHHNRTLFTFFFAIKPF
ncbi:MAG: hypothetical protein JW945_01065 [Methanomicrobia archaeon]|nr:hypothetical protein [Methanomicrobia archaeon]